ncbi:NUDIX hydrolase [Sporomusa sphaeroides]|uniref:ADP-ribose pyrophosphatase n=1 Tax=Sporomusa sphaeroides DSM 2875 TaxID=1337886 RepID=A0ABM9W0R9_9FIRM|nr:NUDIX hydrolase [Sporomusa sphaeroides]OLS58258.1 ADP-ribose pyrophosphatase [Sporomusa sphaeroides DSM 2875]CVK17555.1 ADP-ribose pyrophosphatase [Sporomusa sphaeroides DSM 2875]
MPHTEIDLYEKPVSSNRLFEGKIINLRQDEVMLPNGRTVTREVVEHPGAVAVVPITKTGQVVLVRQFRHPVGRIILEVPAGKLDRNEKPEDCALRELAEETGFVANKLHKLTSMYTTPGFSNEVIHLYLAEDLVESDQRPDEDEFIKTEQYTPEQIRQMIRSGEICDAKSLVALCLAGI